MLSKFEERAALLAVARFGIERRLVDRAAKTARHAQGEGKTTDLIDVLVIEQLLTPFQARELRDVLAGTREAKSAETPSPDHQAETVRPAGASGVREVPRTKSGFYLRSVGDYRVLRRLGEGGMGTVFLGYDPKNRQQVAI